MQSAIFYRVQWTDQKNKTFYVGVGQTGGYVLHAPIGRSKWSRNDALWLKKEGTTLGYRCILIPITKK